MRGVPRSALLLGLVAVGPFGWAALTFLSAPLAQQGTAWFGARLTGATLAIGYGTLMLAFVSGVLCGFATRARGGQAAFGLAVSAVPALWAFLAVGGARDAAAVNLMAGYAGILVLDWMFWRWGFCPEWWMRLRMLLTALVLVCLAVVAWA